MRPGVLALLCLAIVVACGSNEPPTPSTPDDPATVRVVVFLRDLAGDSLHVWFPSTPDDSAGSDGSVTGGIGVACEVVPVGATVAVVMPPGVTSRLDLYTAAMGDADRVFWVELPSVAGWRMGRAARTGGRSRPDVPDPDSGRAEAI